MKGLSAQRRIKMIAATLRLMAAAVENVSNPTGMRGIIKALEETMQLINLCLYDHQTQLIQNAQHGFDQTEVH